MGLMSKIFGRDKGIGNVGSICPYCESELEKRPQRKKKCPHCGNFIYVRTRPSDNKKVLVTEEEAQLVDEEWMKIHGTYEAYREEQKRFEQRKQELSKKFGSEAADADVQWSLFNEDLMVHAQNLNWGLYRNTKYQMAEQLRREGRDRQTLQTFIEVSYLDSNGPSNRGGISSPELLEEFPMFDPKFSFQAPAVVNSIQKLAEKQSLSRTDLEKLFIDTAKTHHESLKLPVTPREAWKSLESELD